MSQDCTATQNRVCNPCTQYQYRQGDCSTTRDTDCRLKTDCLGTQYLVTAATETTNNECAAYTATYRSTEFMFSACTRSANTYYRICKACSSGSYVVHGNL